MNVIDSLEIADGHTIEWGHSTWDPQATSIRNRYEPFSPHSASEFPIEDLEHLVIAAANWNLLDTGRMARMIEALAVSLRQSVGEDI